MNSEFFTRKIGPLPMWGWLAIAVVGIYIYRKRAGASSGTATGLSTTSLPPQATETVTTAGGTYTGPVGGTPPGVYYGSGGSPGNTGTTFAPPTGESLTGIGYGLPTGQQSVQSPTGQTFQTVANWGAAQALINQGQTVYYQPSPGNFAPAAQGGKLLIPGGTGTPLFVGTGQSK
jgi:hypothetical protein